MPRARDSKFAAFISYAHRHQEWVKTLQANLELCLSPYGEGRKVFLDQTDLGPGRSWVTQLQSGLDEADQLVLVVTPEAMASPRVKNEWESLIAADRYWEGRLQVVMLVDTPLPPFLAPIQYVDFRAHDEDRYRSALADLLAGLLGRSDRRDLPELAASVRIPDPPAQPVPVALRKDLVDWLATSLQSALSHPDGDADRTGRLARGQAG